MDRSPPDAATVLARIADAELAPLGYLAGASNATLLCQVGPEADRVHAVYKPRVGERPLWDFPEGTLCAREVAAFLVSDALGWDLVPPTVLRDGPLGEGSVQLFVPHDPRAHYFVLVEDRAHHAALARLALFDLVVNNADRKGSHVLLAEDGRIVGIDHGVSFHLQTKLRTVVWDLGGRRVPRADRADLARLCAALDDPADPLTAALSELLAVEEVGALAARAQAAAGLERLPDLPEDRRAYPWPPL